MSVSGTVLLPIAGRSTRFPGLRPKWMLAAPNGRLMLEMSLNTVPDWRSHRVVIGGLREHLEGLKGEVAIRRAFGDRVEIVQFDQPTAGPAETVSEMVRRAEVSGAFFVKDCDSWFTHSGNVFSDVVCFADLQSLATVRNVAGKSFVTLNEHGIVESILEKQVSSNYISVGGYGFHDATLFQNAYRRLSAAPEGRGEIYISHVIVEAMHQGAVFRGIAARDYEDVGTLEAWSAFRRRQQVYFVDVDGVALRNAGEYLPPFWDDEDVPLSNNIDALKRLQATGAQLIFVTARPERYREKTERALAEAGLRWHAFIFGVHHSSRVLVNDYAPSNPYPSAVAVNLVRNGDDLALFLQN
jgi:phosphoglycolate phosphatase-like HAD superfamily hydrolase